MKKILVISYYFPPVNHVAAQRAEAIQKFFPRFGLEPVIATRHWNTSDKTWESYFSPNSSTPEQTIEHGCTVLRLPYTGSRGYETARRFGKAGHRVYIFVMALLGRTQPELEVYRDFLPHLRKFLEENRVDYILATFQPAGAVKLAQRLSKESGIPFIVDFRDIWSQAAFGITGSGINLPRRALSRIKEFYLGKWLKGASLVSGVNDAIVDRIKLLCPEIRDAVVVTNGFEPALFESAPPLERKGFTISIVGTVYPETDLSIFFKGMQVFLKGKSEGEMILNFVGAGAVPESVGKLRRNLPDNCLRISDRIPHAEAIRELKSSDVLFDVGWKGFKGVTPGKIFDYLGARKNILIAPSDHDTMEKIVNETGAGRIADTVEEFVEILEGWYREWKETGSIDYHGDEEKIRFYTRENQTSILAREILKIGSSSDR